MKDDRMHIHTIQSYLVLESERFYQKIIADGGISHFYSFRSNKDKAVPFLEDGCSNVLFEYSDSAMNSYFIGNSQQLQTIDLKKDCDYFGIRFQPGANPFLQNQEVKDFVGQTINLKDFNVMKGLSSRMEQQDTFTNRMCTFMDEYRNWMQDKNNSQKQLFFQMVNLIVKKDGLLKISELIELSGYSSRYINLLFETYLGCSPKQFCNAVKMHTIVNELNRKEIGTLLDFSTKYKFYDQSHFVHAFKDFTGLSPKEYIETVKQHEYAARVQDEN